MIYVEADEHGLRERPVARQTVGSNVLASHRLPHGIVRALLVEEVDVAALGDRRRLVAHDLCEHGRGDAAVDHPRREGVPHRVERNSLQPRFLRGNIEAASDRVAVSERAAGLRPRSPWGALTRSRRRMS